MEVNIFIQPPLHFYKILYVHLNLNLCSLQNLNYTFVDPVSVPSGTPAVFGDTNKVVYSSVRPYNQPLDCLGKGTQDESTSSVSSEHVCRFGFLF